ncbi:MAG: hypothetical protein P8074_16730 [Anaerolineales bacterium]|jgi:hypothetical protein
MPKKTVVIFMLLLGILLAGCQAASPAGVETTAQSSATAIPTQTPQEKAVEEPTATQAQATRQVASPSEEVIAGTAPPPGCTVVSRIPTPGPTERSIFPAVSDEDWTQGPSDAYVTILEYGDFQ